MPELSGVAIVGAGTFNPAILHPRWLAAKGLIPDDLADHATRDEGAERLIVTGQLAAFVADWLTVQVTQDQAVFSTVDQGRELDLRDFARGVLELLPETPVDALGINADTHFRTPSEDVWHAFGDRFVPKDFWEPLFDSGSWLRRAGGERVGMRVMTVEAHRDDVDFPGYVRIELAPSVRVVPYGVYIGINSHFQLTKVPDTRGNGGDAGRVLFEHWDNTRKFEAYAVAQLLEAV